MGGFSIIHLLIFLAIIILLFGAGRIPSVMGDFAKGIKAFKRGMREDDALDALPPKPVESPSQTPGQLHPGRNLP